MTTRLRHTVVYGIIGLLIAPVMWWLGFLGSEAAAAVVVFAPMAYWTGFRDGERFGEVNYRQLKQAASEVCQVETGA
jgi:hypothetical protein